MSESKKSVMVTSMKTGQVTQLKPANTPQRRAAAGEDEVRRESDVEPTQPDAPSVEHAVVGLPPVSEAEAQKQLKGEDESVGGDEPAKAKSRPKNEPESLEQFLVYAYGLKGRRLSLKPKVQEEVGKQLTLDFDARARLMKLVQEDSLVAVPRQLLLAGMGVKEFPRLRSALREFAREALLAHPIFGTPELRDTFRNLEEAPPAQKALALLSQWRPPVFGAALTGEMKPCDLDELRSNAANALITWLAIERSLTLQDLVIITYDGLWEPRSNTVGDDRSAQVRILTDLTEHAGVGLACRALIDRASKMTSRADSAQRDAAAARDEVSGLMERIDTLTAELADARAQAERDREELENSARRVEETKENEATHLRNDFERLRTRVLRRMTNDVEQLENGLSAVRATEPKIHIVKDRMERVADALRDEIKTLKGEG